MTTRAPEPAKRSQQLQPAQPATAGYAKAQAFLVDQRPEAVAQGRLLEMMDASPRLTQLQAQLDMLNNSPRVVAQCLQPARLSGTALVQGVEKEEPWPGKFGTPAGVQLQAEGHAGKPNRANGNDGVKALVQLRARLSQRAPAALAGEPQAQPAELWQAAQLGISGAVGPLPYLQTIQRSFGRHDLSGIEAHTDAAAAAGANAMEAVAFTIGNHVGFAGPPELDTAAHEAAHTVQQRSGVQLAGGVDPAGSVHERHADAVADRVVRGQSAESLLDVYAGGDRAISRSDRTDLPGTGAPDALVQRRPKRFPTTYVGPKSALQPNIEMAAAEIDSRVLEARTLAMQWHALSHNPQPLVAQWYQAAQDYVAHPEQTPKLIHARFGYAIETLACDSLVPMHGLTFKLQVAHGNTRPDIVICDSDNDEVAWIDITSTQSEDHILDKDGAGWKNRPFVYEILYDPLQLRELLDATEDPFYSEYGKLLADENQIEIDTDEVVKNRVRRQFGALAEQSDWATGIGNAEEKRQLTRNFLYNRAREENADLEPGSKSLKMTHGALSYLDINSGPYGFNVGNIGTDSTDVKAHLENLAAPIREEQKNSLYSSKNGQLISELATLSGQFPAVLDFEQSAYADPTSRAVTIIGVALKSAIGDTQQLDEIERFIASKISAQSDRRVATLRENVEEARRTFPVKADLAQLRAWSEQVRAMGRYTSLLWQVLETRQEFTAYCRQKNYVLFNAPLPVRQIWQLLDQIPQDESAIKMARNYMLGDPVMPSF